MRILGIDPGSIITGFGIIDCLDENIQFVHYDVLKMNSKLQLTQRLKVIYDECINKIKMYKPDLLAIETAFYGKNIQSTLKLGQARGVAIIAALNCNLNVSEYSPREIKKAVTGNGASSKLQVLIFIKNILKLKKEPKYFDSSDALAVAVCHYFASGKFVVLKSPKKTSWKEYVEKNPGKIFK